MQLFIPRLFKLRALKALKGNWQTALLVSFFASIFTITLSVATERLFPQMAYLYRGDAQRFIAAFGEIPSASLIIICVLAALAALMTPVLIVGADNYYLNRLKGTELGFRGLFSRFSIYPRCLLLYAIMFVKTFLWALLFFVPGIIAAFRYAMAPYYLAENPDMTAMEAIEKSKEVMSNSKMSLFMLELSFIGWSLLNTFLGILLIDISPVLSTVVSLLISTLVSAYLGASCAAFYKVVSDPEMAARAAVNPDRTGAPYDGSDDEAFRDEDDEQLQGEDEDKPQGGEGE